MVKKWRDLPINKLVLYSNLMNYFKNPFDLLEEKYVYFIGSKSIRNEDYKVEDKIPTFEDADVDFIEFSKLIKKYYDLDKLTFKYYNPLFYYNYYNDNKGNEPLILYRIDITEGMINEVHYYKEFKDTNRIRFNLIFQMKKNDLTNLLNLDKIYINYFI